MNNRRGFTIVELLIVIVVIAILAAITIVSYNGIQARASDAGTDTALQQLKSALELYKEQQGGYPGVCASDNTGCAVSTLASSLAPTYISTMPTDAGLYQYVRGTGSLTYAIYVQYKTKTSCKTGVGVLAGWWSGVPIC